MQRKSALITGAGNGIGAALAKRLASQGFHISVLDLDGAAAHRMAESINAAGGHAVGVRCDVCDMDGQKKAFDEHAARHGGLDIAVLNAGILEQGSFLDDDDDRGWQRVIDVNLRAALHGVRLAARTMSVAKQRSGTIMLVASAGGVFPIPVAPVYASAKAALVNFVRSIETQLKERGIRIVALCPQPTDTGMLVEARAKNAATAQQMIGDLPMLTIDRVVDGGMVLLMDASVGPALIVFQNGRVTEYPSKRKIALPSDGLTAKL